MSIVYEEHGEQVPERAKRNAVVLWIMFSILGAVLTAAGASMLSPAAGLIVLGAHFAFWGAAFAFADV